MGLCQSSVVDTTVRRRQSNFDANVGRPGRKFLSSSSSFSSSPSRRKSDSILTMRRTAEIHSTNQATTARTMSAEQSSRGFSSIASPLSDSKRAAKRRFSSGSSCRKGHKLRKNKRLRFMDEEHLVTIHVYEVDEVDFIEDGRTGCECMFMARVNAEPVLQMEAEEAIGMHRIRSRLSRAKVT